jgi:acyl carrier protein
MGQNQAVPRRGVKPSWSSVRSSGVVDSLGILSLIGFLEDQHRIVVPATEVVFENFESIAAIRRMVERLPAGLA